MSMPLGAQPRWNGTGSFIDVIAFALASARQIKTLGLAVLATMVLVSLLDGCNARPTFDGSHRYSGTPVEPARPAPDAVLIDQNGRAAHLLDHRAAVTLLFFGYTHCPDECPLALASLGRAYRQLPPAQRSHVRIVFVTVDPARDTRPVIKRYVNGFESHIVGLGGSHAALAHVWTAYGVRVDHRSREIGHGDEIYAIDRTAHIVLIYPPDARSNDLAKDAATLASS